ncbi:MAG TPA: ABC transporter ATP-binding protein [Candidatus Methylomirabilis sp.]|nr:ABC transporter ATP-binding protein [Candidatus Methylomirabilis sp.]
MGKIVLDNVSRAFGSGSRNGHEVLALDSVSLHISDQEIVCLVGPSGCGKSTLVNLIAGFDAPSRGDVLVGGAHVRQAGPDRMVVFQTPALFPWMTVIDNIVFGPRKRGVPLGQCVDDAARYMHAMGLDGFGHHFPYQLSGGMRQRVQIASALVNRPDVLLMDEPFVALDFQTRLGMQELLLQIWDEFHPTILFITHDVEEAVFLADRLYVMTKRPGRIKEEITVPFPKPRTFDIVTIPAFVAIKEHVLQLIRHELNAPANHTGTLGRIPS